MKKQLLLTTTLGSLAAPIVATVSCSSFLSKSGGSANQKSDLEFWNYQDYINPEGDFCAKDIIKKSYDYYEFGDLPDLKQGIIDQRVAAGVGSDYFNAQLAGMGLIEKIDFSRVYGITPDKSLWSSELQKIYSPETWKLLESFTLKKYIKKSGGYVIAHDANGHEINDLDGDGNDDHLWEYMIPYFMQNKVIAFNPFKLKTAASGHEAELTTLRGTDQTVIEALFAQGSKRPTYKQALDKLKTIGFSTFVVNDYFRDNLMIGSESADGSFFSGDVPNNATGDKYINGFMNTLSGWSIDGWKTSGVETLNSLLPHYDGGDSQVSMLYNGDALYAHAGGDVTFEKDEEEHQIRIITPLNPTFLLDGIVIPSYIRGDWLEENRIYNTLTQALYQGVFKKHTDSNYSSVQIYRNFDYVNYTPAFKELHDYMENYYFIDDNNTPNNTSDDSEDLIGKYMAMSTRKIGASIDANHITLPIREIVEEHAEEKFKEKH